MPERPAAAPEGPARPSGAAPRDGVAGRLADWAPLVVAAPILVAVVAAVAHGWTPTGDQAGEIVRIGDVGTRHTPLLGPYSREGWSHPGPLLFWACAPGWRLFGSAGVMATVGLVHAAAAAAAPVLARRVAGASLALAVTAALLLVELSIGAPGLVDVWNPYVGTIVLLTALLALMAAAVGTDWALPVAVAGASWAVQAHVGPALVVVVAGAAAVAVLVVRRHRPSVRWLVVSVAVGGLAWTAPVVEQVTSEPGNLQALVTGLRSPGTDPPAVSVSLEVTASHLGVVPAWVRGTSGLTNDLGSPWTLLIPLVGLAAAAVIGRRRGDAGIVVAATVSAAAFVAAVVSTTRIDLVANEYLYRFTWAVGAVTWAVIVTAGWREIQGVTVVRRLAPRLVPGLAVVGAAATVAVSVTMVTAPSTVPLEPHSDAAAALVDQLVDDLPRDGRYLATSRGGIDLGGVGIGVAVALADDGFDVAFIPLYGRQMGDHRVSEDATRQELNVRAESVPSDEPPSPGATIVAVYDALSEEARARAIALSEAVRDQIGAGPREPILATGVGAVSLIYQGADPIDVEELAELQEQGARYTVWLEPPPS